MKTKRNENGLPIVMYHGKLSADTATEKYELFAAKFRSAFNDSAAQPPQFIDAIQDTASDVLDFVLFDIGEEAASNAIRNLKLSFSAGPDGIPSALLKRCTPALLKPLTRIFSLSFQNRLFPQSWKFSYLFKVHKKGDQCNVDNYRGITILSACSKAFEIMVNNVLFANCKQYISTDQHGFSPKRSVMSNLSQFTSTCIQAIDNGKQVDAVYLDLKTAFDRVDHYILLQKLEKLGASTADVDWFKSYLIDRLLRVKIGSAFAGFLSSACLAYPRAAI